jgi:hypothetical protein
VRGRNFFYSHCGNFFGYITGRGKGTKLSIYETRNYSHVETLWIGGDLIEIIWATYDHIIYVIS